MWSRFFILVGLAVSLVGCPTYEDEHTGRYLEVMDAEREACFESRQCSVVVVDFFRFGDYSQAIIREYDRGLRNTLDTPFVEESRCFWTRADRFGANRTFNLPIRQQSAQTNVLRGVVTEDSSRLSAEFLNDGQSEPTRALTLEFNEELPVSECNSAGDYIITAEATGTLSADLNYEILNPVFVVVWLGLERYESPGGVVYLPTQGAPTWWRLPGSMVTSESHGLSGFVNGIQIPPPDEKFLSNSGQTQFGLAHLVVVDDAPEDDERFVWTVADEPVIATTELDGVPAGSTWELTQPSHGKALFFVKDSLFDLDPAIRERIVNLEGYEWADQHFYVVDYVADAEEIVEIRLPERRVGERPRLRVTADYLDASRIQLPRLFPYRTQ